MARKPCVYRRSYCPTAKSSTRIHYRTNENLLRKTSGERQTSQEKLRNAPPLNRLGSCPVGNPGLFSFLIRSNRRSAGNGKGRSRGSPTGLVRTLDSTARPVAFTHQS